MMSEGALRFPRTSCSSYVVLRVLKLAYGRRREIFIKHHRGETRILNLALGGSECPLHTPAVLSPRLGLLIPIEDVSGLTL